MKSKFTIDGKPQGKGRPRLSCGRIKTQEETVMYGNYIKLYNIKLGTDNVINRICDDLNKITYNGDTQYSRIILNK